MKSGPEMEEQLGSSNDPVNPEIHLAHMHHPYCHFAPYEVDNMTKKQTFVGNFPIPVRKTSTSTASDTDSQLGSSANSTEILWARRKTEWGGWRDAMEDNAWRFLLIRVLLPFLFLFLFLGGVSNILAFC
jgi:hypothetical protein